MKPLFRWRDNGAPAGNGWNSPVNDARWGTNYLNRAGTAKSNMFDNRPEETKYIYTDHDPRASNSTAGMPRRSPFRRASFRPSRGSGH